MFSLLNPFENPQDYNTVTIKGVDVPGKCTIQNAKRSYNWDIKVGKGLWGTTTTFAGRKPSEFSIAIELWTRKHFQDWESLCNKLQYDPTKIRFNPETLFTSGVDAVDIFHPILIQANIKSVVITDIVFPTHKGKGLWACSIDCLEWFPPPKLSVVATPAAATDVPGVQPSQAVSNLEGELSQLRADVAKALKP